MQDPFTLRDALEEKRVPITRAMYYELTRETNSNLEVPLIRMLVAGLVMLTLAFVGTTFILVWAWLAMKLFGM